jgi:hypothetical protein
MAGNQPQVDKPEVRMPAHGDEVIFQPNPADLKFDVRFDSTPFESDHFHNHQPNGHRTGKCDHSKKGTHKYTVTVNGHDLDPVIIVEG